MNKGKIIEVLQMIADDQKSDATNFEGQPFNGRTVSEYFGNQGAAIAALANIIKEVLLDTSGLTPLAADGACTCGNYLPTPGSSYPYPCFNCGKRPAAKA